MEGAKATQKELKGGRYALLGKLGAGSQGATYEAMDNGVGPAARKVAAHEASLADRWARYVREQRSEGEVPQHAKLVAIKCFRVDTARSWKEVELAEREARTLASLDHPCLPKYLEHFEEEGALYLVMEKIEGESLAALRARSGAISVAEVIRMLEHIGGALRYLHGRAPSVVHRDVKPGNILRRPYGSFALVDFGAVRHRLEPAGGSTVVGTFGYMAPEQFQGRASPRSDVYGLAATAMTMLTSVEPENLPHEGLGIDVLRALPEGTPTALARALTAMLVPDPDRRVGSIDAALAILHDRAAAPTQLVTPAARAPLVPREVQRAPLGPRLLGRVGILVAQLIVWVTVGFAVPLVLLLMSLIFGHALRRAALACADAAARSNAALGRASLKLSNSRPPVRALREPAEQPASSSRPSRRS